MKSKLTSKKVEYLYFLYLQKNNFVRQIYFSKLFDVTKVTVSNLMSDLEKDGYIEKNAKKSIKISERGIEAISEYIEDISKITEWLEYEYDISEPKSIIEAIRFCTSMDRKTIENVIKGFERKKSEMGSYTPYNIKAGTYNINFTVLKKDEIHTSMGNIGFVKPCRLVCADGEARLLLRAHEIRYRLLRGKLSKLWYRNRYGEYIAVENENDLYSIPAKAFMMEEQEDRISVKIAIKALSSCGILHMPESEAVISFNLKNDIFKS